MSVAGAKAHQAPGRSACRLPALRVAVANGPNLLFVTHDDPATRLSDTSSFFMTYSMQRRRRAGFRTFSAIASRSPAKPRYSRDGFEVQRHPPRVDDRASGWLAALRHVFPRPVIQTGPLAEIQTGRSPRLRQRSHMRTELCWAPCQKDAQTSKNCNSSGRRISRFCPRITAAAVSCREVEKP